jgi:hypothetical protein
MARSHTMSKARLSKAGRTVGNDNLRLFRQLERLLKNLVRGAQEDRADSRHGTFEPA